MSVEFKHHCVWGMRRELCFDVIEPPKFRLDAEDHRCGDKRPSELFRPAHDLATERRTAQKLEAPPRCSSLRADDLERIDSRQRGRERELDRELIPGPGVAFDRRRQPGAGLAA